MIQITLEELIEALKKHNIQEKPKSDLSLAQMVWPDSLSDTFLERFLPPGKRLRLPTPEGPKNRLMEPAEIHFVCRKLRVDPAVFGIHKA